MLSRQVCTSRQACCLLSVSHNWVSTSASKHISQSAGCNESASTTFLWKPGPDPLLLLKQLTAPDCRHGKPWRKG